MATTIATSATINAESGYHINIVPSISGWLDTMCQLFQEWRLTNLRFEFEPVLPTTAGGRTITGANIDFTEGSPTASELVGMPNSVTTRLWEPNSFSMPRTYGSKWYNYIPKATFEALNDSEKADYSPGKFHLIVADSDRASTRAGYLRIHYTIEVRNPAVPRIN